MPASKLRCLFLGDSYPAGTAVSENLRWPVQLTNRLNLVGLETERPYFIVGNGWTTEDLIQAMAAKNPLPDFDLVFLMIGVNNQFHGRPFVEFQSHIRALISRAIDIARDRADRVFVLAIPDYSVTPFAADKKPAAIASEISLYNRECAEVSKDLDVNFLDTADISRRAGTHQGLLISDGLHPSEEMYRLWSDFIFDKLEGHFSEVK